MTRLAVSNLHLRFAHVIQMAVSLSLALPAARAFSIAANHMMVKTLLFKG